MRPAALLALGLGIATAAACDNSPKVTTTEGRAGVTETTSGNIDVADASSPEGFLQVKKAYINQMEANIAAQDQRLRDLRKRTEDMDDSPRRAQIRAAIRNARTQRDLFRLDVRSLGYESQETWKENRGAMDKKWEAFRASIDRIEHQLDNPTQ